ncbi:MAG: hypothetical protein IJ849_00995 [Selenomonadaceae bacterium]|nr:hypothetical protein [Selenomonadaceae bacterium]
MKATMQTPITVQNKVIRRIPRPKARDEMTDEEFYTLIEEAMEDVRQGRTIPAKECFASIRRELGWGEL